MVVCAIVFVTVERYTILFLFADVLSCYFVVFHSVRFHTPDIMCLHAFVVVANYVLTVIVLSAFIYCKYLNCINLPQDVYQLTPCRGKLIHITVI